MDRGGKTRIDEKPVDLGDNERRERGEKETEGNRANEYPAGRLTSVTFVKPWPEPPGDTCNELINLIYRRLTEIQSQMRGTLIVRPLATDTIVYTVDPYSLTIALQLVSPRSQPGPRLRDFPFFPAALLLAPDRWKTSRTGHHDTHLRVRRDAAHDA